MAISDKWMKAVFSGDKIEIKDDGTMNYYFYVSGFPFCTDGYKHEIEKEIEKRGFLTGFGGFVFKENITPSELIECMIFKSAYDYTYYNEIGEETNANLKNLRISISEFMKKVDENIEKIKKDKVFRLNWDDVYSQRIK